MTWQPIETAPKDGTSVILAAVRDGKYVVGEGLWEGDAWWWANEWGDYNTDQIEMYRQVTHWMPLPDPPAGTDA